MSARGHVLVIVPEDAVPHVSPPALSNVQVIVVRCVLADVVPPVDEGVPPNAQTSVLQHVPEHALQDALLDVQGVVSPDAIIHVKKHAEIHAVVPAREHVVNPVDQHAEVVADMAVWGLQVCSSNDENKRRFDSMGRRHS